MNPGELSRKITIESKTITQDAELNSVETWATFKTLWAKPIPANGSEFYRLATVNSSISEAFKIRYLAGITPQQRVKFGSKYLEIISIINVGEENKELILTCKGVF